jgi:hypothetical protein
MGVWVRLLPILVDGSLLPGEWDLIRNPTRDEYVVTGRAGADRPRVVIRIAYAVDVNGGDIRRMVGTGIALGMESAVRRSRRPTDAHA